MQIHDVLNSFYRDLEINGRSKATVRNQKLTWQLFLKKFPISNVSELSEALLRRFFLWGSHERKWKTMTIISHRKNISVFIVWCLHKKRGYLTENPLTEIKKPRHERKVPRHYTKEQLETVMYAVDRESKTHFERIRNQALFATAMLVGVRRGELLNLRVQDINFHANQLLVKAETSKVRQERIIPMPLNLVQALQKYLAVRDDFADPKCPYLWVSAKTRQKLSDDGLKHVTAKISDATGFRVKMHSLRHSCATYAYAASKDILAVQKMLGHADIGTTMIYTSVLGENTREAVELSPLNDLFQTA